MHVVFCKIAPPGAVQWRLSAVEPASCPLSHAWCSHLLTKVPVALESGSDPVIRACHSEPLSVLTSLTSNQHWTAPGLGVEA